MRTRSRYGDRNQKRGKLGRPNDRVRANDRSLVLQGGVQKANWGKKGLGSTSSSSVSSKIKFSLSEYIHSKYLNYPQPLHLASNFPADTVPSVPAAYPVVHLAPHALHYSVAKEPMEIDVPTQTKTRKGKKKKGAGGPKQMEVERSPTLQ